MVLFKIGDNYTLSVGKTFQLKNENYRSIWLWDWRNVFWKLNPDSIKQSFHLPEIFYWDIFIVPKDKLIDLYVLSVSYPGCLSTSLTVPNNLTLYWLQVQNSVYVFHWASTFRWQGLLALSLICMSTDSSVHRQGNYWCTCQWFSYINSVQRRLWHLKRAEHNDPSKHSNSQPLD